MDGKRKRSDRKGVAKKKVKLTSKQSPGAALQHSGSDEDGNVKSDTVSDSDTNTLHLASTSSTPKIIAQPDNHPLSLGTPITELKSTPKCAEVLSQLSQHTNNTVFFKPSNSWNTIPNQWPQNSTDKWNDNYVKMPCSSRNLYRDPDSRATESGWSVIKDAFKGQKINSSLGLEKAILSYNTKQKRFWNFNGLHYLFQKEFSPSETNQFFDKTLPGVVQLALQLPQLITQPIPLLKQNMNHTIFLSQMQIASLLANAFLCTFPQRNYSKPGKDHTYPAFNFSGLFANYRQKRVPAVTEKLKCLINYFHRVVTKNPCGTVSFYEAVDCPVSFMDQQPGKAVQIACVIDGYYRGLSRNATGFYCELVDFADKYLGGLVLGIGAVQEEIRFVMCPELIVGLLFTEYLLDHESVIMKGAEQFNKYKGYSRRFQWDGDFVDSTPRDEWGRRHRIVIAIDAMRFRRQRKKSDQYTQKYLLREVNKAYCGFRSDTPPANLEAVATGNWGCGIFGGDARLKSLLQIIAASKAGRDLVYLTFKDDKLCKDIFDMHTFLTEKNVSIGDLWKQLEQYSTSGGQKMSIYDYLYKYFQ